MPTTRTNWWREPWVWVVAVPVLIVGTLTITHQTAAPATVAAPVSSAPLIATAPPATTVAPAVVTTVLPPPAPPTTTTTTTTTTPPADLCGAPPNPLGYNYCGHGSLIDEPDAATCIYFHCIGNWDDGKGHMEECGDGEVSMSGGRSGSCSDHDGDAIAVRQD